MDRSVKQIGLLAVLLALLAGVAVYLATTTSDGAKTDRNVPGATTGPGKADLAN